MFTHLQIDPSSPSGLTWGGSALPQLRGKTAGSKQKNPAYWCVWVNKKLYRNHRVIMSIKLGVSYADCPLIDHEDGDSYNNSELNLRVANHRQNLWNTGVTKASTTGHKGVTRRRGKYRATICGKYLGDFIKLEDAITALDHARKEAHCEFARN